MMRIPDRQLKVCALQPGNEKSQFNSQHCFGGAISLSKKLQSCRFATGCTYINGDLVSTEEAAHPLERSMSALCQMSKCQLSMSCIIGEDLTEALAT